MEKPHLPLSKPQASPTYDLISELGPSNRYDKLAGEAQDYGTRWRKSTLVSKGTRLAELISTIPYDHDDFYKVVALANEIEDEINKNKKYKQIIETLSDERAGNYSTWEYELAEFDGINIICISNWYGKGKKEDRSPLEVLQLLEDYAKPNIDISKSTSDVGQHETIDEYFNSENQLVVEHTDRIHESGEEGFSDRYFVYDRETAEMLWQRIKEIRDNRVLSQQNGE